MRADELREGNALHLLKYILVDINVMMIVNSLYELSAHYIPGMLY